MKTNTFIFNFINPSRLVYFAPLASNENSPKGKKAEVPSDVNKAPEVAKSDALKQAEEKRQKAWFEVLEGKEKLEKAKTSEDIAKCVKSLAEANVKFDKAGYDLSTLMDTENAKEREARLKELRDPWAAEQPKTKAIKEFTIDAKNVDRVLLKLDMDSIDSLDANKLSDLEKMAKNMQTVPGENKELGELRTKAREKFIAKIKQIVNDKDRADSLISIASETSKTKAVPEKNREIVKADPKTKKEVAQLVANKPAKLVEFATKADLNKGWEQLNKEFLAALGITGGSDRAHIKALQEVLFGEKVRDAKATDGKLGRYTLAKLQEKLGVVPQQNLEGGSYNDRVLAFLNKRVDFAKVGAANLAKLTDKNTTAEQKIAILKAEMGGQRNMDEKRVDNMLAQTFKPETAQTLMASAEPEYWEKQEEELYGQSIPPVEEKTAVASAEPEDLEKQEEELYGQSIPPVEEKTAVASKKSDTKKEKKA